MPSFHIRSLFEQQLDKCQERYAKVRRELDGFVETAEKLAGREVADVFRGYLNVPWGWRYRGERLPEIPSEGLPFLDQFLDLNHREAALCRKMRNSATWFYDSLVEPYVLWCYRWYWDEVESLLDDDRRLPMERVRMLLEVLLTEKPRFPTLRLVADVGADPDVLSGWKRTFKHKRRNLVWLFQTALRLGEEVVYSTM